ncbi:hypothetical protein JTB14_006271 [Gonioctena quinquepunctata]|nr:hypothetical protein JTB14_006271 [Gonioctena quinquepunctata]
MGKQESEDFETERRGIPRKKAGRWKSKFSVVKPKRKMKDVKYMETKRICNFSKLETDTLMTLVKKYKDVVECKKSDAVKWKEKLNAWEEIRVQFDP